jgi:CheY-like chemotaxis protein
MSAPEASRPLTVLIVDDEPVNRLVLARMVEHFGSHSVEAANGAEALELLRSHSFDLVLMDIHMPQMSGIQALQRLRNGDGPNAETPVVAVTGDTTRERPEYIALGFDDYATKPISLAAVQSMLNVRRVVAPTLRRTFAVR